MINCTSPLGMKNKAISDQAITSSTTFSVEYGPEKARLNRTGGWKPLNTNLGQWIQVDLGNITKVTGVATQGVYELEQWLTEYSLSYNLGDGPYMSYKDDQVLL